MNNKHEIQVNGYEIEEAQEINLREYWEKLRRRKGTIIAVTVAVLALGAFWTFIQKPRFTARATLLIEKEPNILSFEQVLQIETLRDDFYQTQYRLLEGRALAEDVIRRLELFKHREFIGDPARLKTPADPSDHVFMENLVDSFLKRLDVKPVRMTRLVQVNFEAGDPRLAADCVNTLADAFIDQNIEMKFEATEQATKFISDQISSLQDEIEAMERQLQGYEAKANIVALSDNETTIIERLGEINKALTAAQIDRLRKESVYNELRNMSSEYIPEAINNPLIQRLREEYVRLKRDVQKMEELFQPEYPELQRRKVEMESARKSLEDETQNLVRSAYSDFQTALNEERSLEKAFNEQRDLAFQLNSDAILYSGLKIQIANKKELLDSLLRRESETGVSARLKGLRTSNIRIVDRARTPVRPSSPNKKRNLILALLLGLGGGVGLAFLFDFMDNTVKTGEDVDRYSGLPTLGVVPKFSLDGAGRARLIMSRRRELGRGVAGELPEGKRAGEAASGEAGVDDAAVDHKAAAREVKKLRKEQRERDKERKEEEKRRKAKRGRFVSLDIGGATPDLASKARETGPAEDSEPQIEYVPTTEPGSAPEVPGWTAAAAAGDEARSAPSSEATSDRAAEPPPGPAGGTPDSPFVAQVPAAVEQEPRAIELVPYYFPNSRLAEAYRSIRTALLLSSVDRPVKTIAVTSPLPGEGKTVTVANLAITLAQSEKTVLIVDADLRKPRQHRLFRIKNIYGLTSYLTERVEIRKVIKSTPIPNLYVVNSGPIPPNPAELLGSEKMSRFIRMLSEECDYILFDLPPMLEISDALVLGAKVDGTVLVVQGDKTSREALKRAREKMDLLKVRTLGVVINNVDVQKHSYYYGHYYYGGYHGYHRR